MGIVEDKLKTAAVRATVGLAGAAAALTVAVFEKPITNAAKAKVERNKQADQELFQKLLTDYPNSELLLVDSKEKDDEVTVFTCTDLKQNVIYNGVFHWKFGDRHYTEVINTKGEHLGSIQERLTVLGLPSCCKIEINGEKKGRIYQNRMEYCGFRFEKKHPWSYDGVMYDDHGKIAAQIIRKDVKTRDCLVQVINPKIKLEAVMLALTYGTMYISRSVHGD